MNPIAERIMAIRPNLLERRTGGWLATSPADALVHFGVTAADRDDAIAQFSASARMWAETLYGQEQQI